MKRAVLFVVGPSGVGKTTLVRALLGSPTGELARWTVGTRCAAAGPYTGATLDGGDSLPGCMPVVEKMLDTMDLVLPPGLPVLLDGQRFGAWAMTRLAGKATLVAVWMRAPVHVLASRRALRGSSGLPVSALDGQASAAGRVAAMADVRVIVDATQAREAIVRAVLASGHVR